MRSRQKIFVADFETANSPKNLKKGFTFVWLWDICSLKNFSHVSGKYIDDFVKFFEKTGSCIVWMHNLKFDGMFLINWLLKNNYRIEEVGKALQPGSFSTIISGEGEFFQIKFCIKCNKKKKIIVELRDSSKKIKTSVRQIAESFELPVEKGEIDYEKERDEFYVADVKETDYCKNDTEIVARALSFLYAEGLDKLTIGSDALSLFKNFCGKQNWTMLFPTQKIEIDDFLRKSYRGGLCMCAQNVQRKKIDKTVYVYDVNSLYASIMCECELPFGQPEYYNGKFEKTNNRTLFIQHVWACFEIKKEKTPHLIRKDFCCDMKNQKFWTNSFGEMIELWLTNVDLELLFENYEIFDIKFIDGFKFFASKNLFKSFLLPIYVEKCRTKGARRQIQKSLLVELYGKFATNPRRTNKTPKLLNDRVVFETAKEPKEIDSVYTAISCFITAYGRKKLIKAIEANKDDFVYCDTDSIHLTKEAKGIFVDNAILGAWKQERVYSSALYFAQKMYAGQIGSNIEIKLAGANDEVKKGFNFDNFRNGVQVFGKLKPVTVRGGVVLKKVMFTLREH